ncbi:hypothetical protein [Streptomyces rhizosphaericus]|uniref:Uncharacterized protein n=1 Tax=Streptomyces rhizosphaericus TaxID=114699 RepID=A0A6G4AEH3_9ACTN|nr:hypothetical protein [Streptomyces rhizosphaericus]NEW71618.1 hypothetical protein [Streptomyces rhizosphaericus]
MEPVPARRALRHQRTAGATNGLLALSTAMTPAHLDRIAEAVIDAMGPDGTARQRP